MSNAKLFRRSISVYADIATKFEDHLLQQFLRHLIKGERSVSGDTILRKDIEQDYKLHHDLKIILQQNF